MKLRNWLSAVLAVTLVSLTAGPSLADARSGKAERIQPASSASARIAQSRTGRMDRASPPPPTRGKQAKLEPKPPANASRQRASGPELKAGRGRH